MSTAQTPIGSGFTATSTAADVIQGIDLTGKIAIVTGGYSGIGLETVRVFARAGARVVVPARDLVRAKAALEGIARAEIAPMDLTDPVSIDAFAAQFLGSKQPLHLLVNNAGIMALPDLTRDARGHELHFATNHLGHFQLTLGLWPALARAQGSRVVSVASVGHRFAPVTFDDIDFAHRPYSPWTAYGQSKTANILFAVELDRRGEKDGIRGFALHPGGIVGTGLVKHIPIETLQALGALDASGRPVIDPARDLKTVPQGAATQVWCATSPRLDHMGGVYCENSDIAQMQRANAPSMTADDTLGQSGVAPYSVDPATAAKLWAVSEDMLKLPASR